MTISMYGGFGSVYSYMYSNAMLKCKNYYSHTKYAHYLFYILFKAVLFLFSFKKLLVCLIE